MLIISMSDRIEALSKRSGKVGEKAKVNQIYKTQMGMGLFQPHTIKALGLERL